LMSSGRLTQVYQSPLARPTGSSDRGGCMVVSL
jgi:hypothetical protein